MTLKRRLLRLLAVRANVVTGPDFHAGFGSRLWAPRGLSVGREVYVGKHVTIEVDGVIGDGTMIANGVGIVGRNDHDITEVGRAVRRTSWVGDFPERLSRQVTVGADVWIGFGSVILSGVTIGDSAVIGAGSVVTKDVPANAICVGSPARVVSKRFTPPEFAEHWSRLKKTGYEPVTSHEDFEIQ
ncbi:acyltransferase [Microbacterium oleivorans]|uniref:acyltransferase n=1 Tax=Microbacterium oleivorans TaxID=273677 RepID=UPI001CB907F7|nr:acyltransferase [Microbacterium oleivorans]